MGNKKHQTLQAGFSLVELMITAAVMGMLTMGFASMVTHMGRSAKSSQQAAELSNLMTTTQGILTNPTTCTQGFQNAFIFPELPEGLSPEDQRAIASNCNAELAPFKAFLNGSGKPLFENGSQIGTLWVGSSCLRWVSGLLDKTQTIGSRSQNIYKGTAALYLNINRNRPGEFAGVGGNFALPPFYINVTAEQVLDEKADEEKEKVGLDKLLPVGHESKSHGLKVNKYKVSFCGITPSQTLSSGGDPKNYYTTVNAATFGYVCEDVIGGKRYPVAPAIPASLNSPQSASTSQTPTSPEMQAYLANQAIYDAALDAISDPNVSPADKEKAYGKLFDNKMLTCDLSRKECDEMGGQRVPKDPLPASIAPLTAEEKQILASDDLILKNRVLDRLGQLGTNCDVQEKTCLSMGMIYKDKKCQVKESTIGTVGTCAQGEYLAGFNADGSKICRSLPALPAPVTAPAACVPTKKSTYYKAYEKKWAYCPAGTTLGSVTDIGEGHNHGCQIDRSANGVLPWEAEGNYGGQGCDYECISEVPCPSAGK